MRSLAVLARARTAHVLRFSRNVGTTSFASELPQSIVFGQRPGLAAVYLARHCLPSAHLVIERPLFHLQPELNQPADELCRLEPYRILNFFRHFHHGLRIAPAGKFLICHVEQG